MSRTSNITTVEEFVKQRTFRKYISEWSADLELMDPNADEFYKQELENIPMTPSYGYRQQTQRRNYSRQNLAAINKKYLEIHRPNLSANLVASIVEPTYSSKSSGEKITSMFMLNEFLAQNEFDVYHDFLNEHWDNLHYKSVNFQITEYPHTKDVYKHYHEDSPLTFRPKAAKKTRMALESLTKAQLLKIVTTTKLQHVSTNSLEIYFKNQIAAISGKVERQMSRQEATNQLLRAFSAALLAGGSHSNLSLTSVYANMVEIIGLVNGRIANDSINYSTHQITPNDLGKIGTFLEENGASFSLAEMFFVIYSIANPKLFSRTGTSSEVADIYQEFLAQENALEIFKMIGELALTYKNQFPTMVQWKKALANGDLDFIMSSDMTAVMVAATDKPGKITGETQMRRKLFGGGV